MLAGTLKDNLLLTDRAGEDLPRAVLALLGVQGLADQLGRECLGASGRPVSGGERKWIALARAVASGLPVLLLDEPTAGLDRSAERCVLDALTRLRGSHTIILVSHQPEPLAIADTVIRMRAQGDGDTPSFDERSGPSVDVRNERAVRAELASKLG